MISLRREPGFRGGSARQAAAPVKQPACCEEHQSVSIVFCQIQGCAALLRNNPTHWAKYMHCVQLQMDEVAKQHNCYKVKASSLGQYIAVANLTSPNPSHADDAVACALQMLQVKAPDGSPVEVLVGVHSGEVASGVVGSSMIFFVVYGEAMHLAQCLQQTSLPGRVQISEAAYKLLSSGSKFTFRGSPRFLKDTVTNVWMTAEEPLQFAPPIPSMRPEKPLPFKADFWPSHDATKTPDALLPKQRWDLMFADARFEAAYLAWKGNGGGRFDLLFCGACWGISLLSALKSGYCVVEASALVSLLPFIVLLAYSVAMLAGVLFFPGYHSKYREMWHVSYEAVMGMACCLPAAQPLNAASTLRFCRFGKLISLALGLFGQVRFSVLFWLVLFNQTAVAFLTLAVGTLKGARLSDLVIHICVAILLPLAMAALQDSLSRRAFVRKQLSKSMIAKAGCGKLDTHDAKSSSIAQANWQPSASTSR